MEGEPTSRQRELAYAIITVVVLLAVAATLNTATLSTLGVRLLEIPHKAAAMVASMQAQEQPPQPTTAPINEAPVPRCTPARVVDALAGDTIKVSIADQTYVICYAGIDSPDPATVIGSIAIQANRRFVKGKTVYLEEDESNTDQNGCLSRHVLLKDGTLVNATLVQWGYATVNNDSINARYRGLLLQVQQEAQGRKWGLWNISSKLAALPAESAQEPIPKVILPVGIPTPTPGPTPIPLKADIKITELQYADTNEYIRIENRGTGSQAMTNWRIRSVAGDQSYTFPLGYVLNAGASVYVHTGIDAQDKPPEHLRWILRHIWNDDGDQAQLYDSNGKMIDCQCYKNGCPCP